MHSPWRPKNLLSLIKDREIKNEDSRIFSKRTQVLKSSLDRLDLLEEMEGHEGCVNCVEFNEEGNLLVSGSDDFNILLWDVYKRKQIGSFTTGHRGNIFTVKFLPQTNSNKIVSGAGDQRIEVRELSTGETLHVCTCHFERIKRIATIPSTPNIFLSASEDGTILQYDTREQHTCSKSSNLLIDLKCHSGTLAECKCVDVHPIKNEIIAVGASDPFIRIYDRRMINTTSITLPSIGNGSSLNRASWARKNGKNIFSANDNLPPGCVQYFAPGHLPVQDNNTKCRALATTYLKFSHDGSHLLANLGGDYVYLFDMVNSQQPKQFKKKLKLDKDHLEKQNLFSNLDTVNGHIKSLFQYDSLPSYPPESLPERIELRLWAAKLWFLRDNYTKAIDVLNSAILEYKNVGHLYSCRAAVLLNRKWDGDVYAALRDSDKAVEFNPLDMKSHFRIIRCLHLLGRSDESRQLLSEILSDHPQVSASSAWPDFEERLLRKINESGPANTSEVLHTLQTTLEITSKEIKWRSSALDYKKVYMGHCNTTTDIKEAVFIGQNDDYVAAGSDDGNLFIWDRHTSNVVRIIEADNSIVNCVQSHPNVCILATSGIEPVVKLWGASEKIEETQEEDDKRITQITEQNQRRMRIDPLETMYFQMTDILDGGEGLWRDRDTDEPPIQCRQA